MQEGPHSGRRRRRYGPMGPWWPPWYDPRYGPPDVLYPGVNPWNPFAPAMPRRAEDEVSWLEEQLEDLEDEKIEIERAIEDVKKQIDRKKRDLRDQTDVR